MVRISKGKLVRAFDWWGFGWVCITLALGGEMQRGVYTMFRLRDAGGRGYGWRV